MSIKGLARSEQDVKFKMPGDEICQSLEETARMHPTLSLLTEHFSPSHYEGIFTIHYRLDTFIKHSSKTEFGMGNFVSFPIKIKGGHQDLPLLKEY